MRISVKQLRRIIKESMEANLPADDDRSKVEAAVQAKINQYEADKWNWHRSAKNDFYSMAEGGDLGGVRSKYYPGWTDEDFQTVIAAIEGSYEPYGSYDF